MEFSSVQFSSNVIRVHEYRTSLLLCDNVPYKLSGVLQKEYYMDLRSTEPLTEMSGRNLPGSKVRPARKSDSLTAICEPII
jgi:hypothetical protein